MPLKISAFHRSLSVFDCIGMAKTLDADGLEMYEGFFTSLDRDYVDSVAAFYEEYLALLRSLEIAVSIYPKPVEVSDPIPFAEDRQHASYDKEFAHRLAHTEALGYSIQKFSRALPREIQPGSFLLGQLRFSGNPIFRAAGSSSSRCRAMLWMTR